MTRPSSPPALCWDIDLYDSSDECMKDCVKVGYVPLDFDYDKYLLERPVYNGDHDYPEVDEVRLQDDYIAYLLDDRYRLEPIGSHLTRQYYDYLAPPYFKVILPSTDKDQLFDDITEVVGKEELSPAQLTADEYTHWMMMFLREEVTQVEYNLISRAMGEHPRVRLARLSDDTLLSDLFCLLLPLLADAAKRIKYELVNVPQPLYELCNLHRYKVCTEISETVQVADLRRMSLGSRFIGRSHLIWAFYKLGYALPLEIRIAINVSDSDEDHPPYHIYMTALKLTLCSGEKMMQLDHFIYAVLNSKDIDFDGEQWTEFYQDFKDFQKALESMETEVEPKSTVTVRPCGSLNVFSDSCNDSDDSQERTTDF